MRITPPRELDPATAPELEALIRPIDPSTEVVLDFADVDFCDSSGLRVLVEAYQRFNEAGGSIRVVNARPHVRRVFEVTALDDRFLSDGS